MIGRVGTQKGKNNYLALLQAYQAEVTAHLWDLPPERSKTWTSDWAPIMEQHQNSDLLRT